MFAGHSLGRAYRPSRFSNEPEPERLAEATADREKRIRIYSRRVRMRMPLFEGQPVADAPGEVLAGA